MSALGHPVEAGCGGPCAQSRGEGSRGTLRTPCGFLLQMAARADQTWAPVLTAQAVRLGGRRGPGKAGSVHVLTPGPGLEGWGPGWDGVSHLQATRDRAGEGSQVIGGQE